MKKLLYIIPLLFGMTLTSCYNDDIIDINNRLYDLEKDTRIATIQEQIAGIQNSLTALDNTDKELGEYITGLEAEAERLQSQITAANTKIDEVKTEVLSTISSEKTELLAELETFRKDTTTRLEEIGETIAELKAADGDMSAQIEALEAEAQTLEAKLAETNTKIDNVKNELTETISTEKAAILAELEAFKATVNGELEAINAVLETLKAKDAELEEQIADLKEYVDSELTATEDWATATFATLEQYNTVVSTIATIEGTIEGLNESIVALETRINDKIAKDIETACATLSADLKKAIEEITEEYTAAIATATEEITAAYTAKLESAISALETSMKEWVNQRLNGYYTITEMDAKLMSLHATFWSEDITIKEQMEELSNDLESAKQTITESYTSAIEEAITTNYGILNEKIATEIEAVNEKITVLETRLNSIEARLTKVENTISSLEEQVTNLVSRIQSISYIPQYNDGKASIDETKMIGVFDFQISPKDAVADLANVWQSALTMQAIHTQTRAVSFIELPVTYFEADVDNGTFSIEVDAANLGEYFFSGEIEASASLHISDGNNDRSSEYINLVLGEVDGFRKEPYTNEIWYTTTTASLVNNDFTSQFNVKKISNEYKNGRGVMTFEGDVTWIGDAFRDRPTLSSVTLPSSVISLYCTFYNCSNLTKVHLNNGLQRIGMSTFWMCEKLTEIDIPNSVTEIDASAFSGCSSLVNITIPESVTSIGNFTFSRCTNLKEVYCKSITPPTITDDDNELYGEMFYNVSSELKIYVPQASVNAYKNASFWNEYAEKIVGYDF